jgi:hypothetical protein
MRMWRRCVSLVAVLVGMSLSWRNVRADAVDDLRIAAGNRLSDKASTFFREGCPNCIHWVQHTEPCRKVSDVGGWWWAATCADGFVVYNCFRKCRGTNEVAYYFLGLNVQGDCDAWSKRYGRANRICFPRDAQALANAHGPIIAIRRLGECRE